MQTDPGYSILEKDLIYGITESIRSYRPDIKDIILHEQFLKDILKHKSYQDKITSTLHHTKGNIFKRLEVKLRAIANDLKNPKKKKKGYFSKMGTIFSKSKGKMSSIKEDETYERQRSGRNQRNLSQSMVKPRNKNGKNK